MKVHFGDVPLLLSEEWGLLAPRVETLGDNFI
jgi:hypothetical protein